MRRCGPGDLHAAENHELKELPGTELRFIGCPAGGRRGNASLER
ncbi:hypothetical protein HMPREF1545_01405 [Oscillibacter sp. KLE 1728]|nr:hypothetical protein HMPREF1545_01405 [Oscillibacter sp. KLE 1728]ERK64851.1 hypothetical protein HMPREF1546_01541 [Oscillibacter sp. KLE 1745]